MAQRCTGRGESGIDTCRHEIDYCISRSPWRIASCPPRVARCHMMNCLCAAWHLLELLSASFFPIRSRVLTEEDARCQMVSSCAVSVQFGSATRLTRTQSLSKTAANDSSAVSPSHSPTTQTNLPLFAPGRASYSHGYSY